MERWFPDRNHHHGADALPFFVDTFRLCGSGRVDERRRDNDCGSQRIILELRDGEPARSKPVSAPHRRPAADFAERLMLPVSDDALLRVVRRRGMSAIPPPTVIGIDDWAWTSV